MAMRESNMMLIGILVLESDYCVVLILVELITRRP